MGNSKNKNKFLPSLLSILILMSFSIVIVSAEDTQSNVTGQPTTAVTAPVETTVKEGKFRVGPTVKIRPLNDLINKSADGIIELYFDNPSLNDVPLTVDVHINVPSGINIYGQGFGEAVAAGTLYAKLSIPPGTIRTAYVNIKAEKTGDFYTQFSGTYYPGDNKDDYQPISLTYPFKVYEPSPDPKSADLTNSEQIPGTSGGWKDKVMPAIIIALIAGLIGLGYKIVEIRYQHKLQTESKTTKTRTIEGTVTEHETTETKTEEKK